MFPENMIKMFAETNQGFSLESSPDKICFSDGESKICMTFEQIGMLMFFHNLTPDDIMAELKRLSIENKKVFDVK